MQSVDTTLGAILCLYEAPEHLGPGLMLEIKMQNPADRRRAEVFLSSGVIHEFEKALAIEKLELRIKNME